MASSILARITTGVIRLPPVVILYGTDGVGKTTMAAEAPRPIFIGTEQGTANLDVARFNPGSWGEVLAVLKDLADEEHPYKTVVIDSLDWMEPLVHSRVCRENGNARSIELAAGGYGKGYKEAMIEWQKFKEALETLRNKKSIGIILIAHSEIVSFNDPATQMTYERFQLKLHKTASAFFREYADAVLFLNYEVFAKKDGNAVKAYGDGERIAWTERRPGFDAKNRLDLPFQIPLSKGEAWAAFIAAADKGRPESVEAILKRIEDLKTDIKDEAMLAKVVGAIEKAAGNAGLLTAIEKRLKALA